MEELLSSEAHANSYQAVLLAEHAGWPNVPVHEGGCEARTRRRRRSAVRRLGFILSQRAKGRGRPPIVDPIVVLQQARSAHHAQDAIAQAAPRAGKVIARPVSRAIRCTLRVRARRIAHRFAGPGCDRPECAPGIAPPRRRPRSPCRRLAPDRGTWGVPRRRAAPPAPSTSAGSGGVRRGSISARPRAGRRGRARRRPRLGRKPRHQLRTVCRLAPARLRANGRGDDDEIDDAAGLDRIVDESARRARATDGRAARGIRARPAAPAPALARRHDRKSAAARRGQAARAPATKARRRRSSAMPCSSIVPALPCVNTLIPLRWVVKSSARNPSLMVMPCCREAIAANASCKSPRWIAQ